MAHCVRTIAWSTMFITFRCENIQISRKNVNFWAFFLVGNAVAVTGEEDALRKCEKWYILKHLLSSPGVRCVPMSRFARSQKFIYFKSIIFQEFFLLSARIRYRLGTAGRRTADERCKLSKAAGEVGKKSSASAPKHHSSGQGKR